MASKLKLTSSIDLTDEGSGSDDEAMRYRVKIMPRSSQGRDPAEEETLESGFISLDDAIRGGEIALSQRTIGEYTYDVVNLDGSRVRLPWQADCSKGE